MVKVHMKASAKERPVVHQFKNANTVGIHPSGLVYLVSHVTRDDAGPPTEEHQIALFCVAHVDHCEVIDGPNVAPPMQASPGFNPNWPKQ